VPSAEANHGLVRSWVVSLVENDIDAASVNRKIACLRSYYKFLLRQEVIHKDPMSKIKILKTKKKLPHFVQEADMVKALDQIEFTKILKEFVSIGLGTSLWNGDAFYPN